MNTSKILKITRGVALITVFALIGWTVGLPAMVNEAFAAASLKNVSVLLSDSDLNVAANNTIDFQLETALDPDDTIVVTYDPTGSLFTVGSLGAADFVGETGVTVVATCDAGADSVELATTTETITLTVCASASLAADTSISLPTTNNRITNPNAADSYVVRIETTQYPGATLLDKSEPRVVILDDVVVSAAVSTSFTFTVALAGIGVDINGDTTTIESTATSLPFGTIASSTGAQVIGHNLTVATNAKNGFSVTVEQDTELISSTGAIIDNFKDGADTATPEAWVAPSNDIDDPTSWGHFGVTSEDSSTTAGNEFGDALYAGNLASAREIFYHSGPADGVTADKGATQVAYKVQITDLQEAGDDYTNTLMYIATPTF